MENGVLIAGKTTPFLADLIQEGLKRSYSVIASRDPANADSAAPGEPGEEPGEHLLYLPWKRRSLISARSLLLQAGLACEGTPGIIVAASPEGVHSPFHQTGSALIEERIDESLKGYLFLLKESLAYLLQNGGGMLTFVLFDGGAEVMAPVDAAIRGALTGLVQSLFEFYEAEPVDIRALHATDADSQAMAGWVFDSVSDRSSRLGGRWVRYGQRSGLFGIRK